MENGENRSTERKKGAWRWELAGALIEGLAELGVSAAFLAILAVVGCLVLNLYPREKWPDSSEFIMIIGGVVLVPIVSIGILIAYIITKKRRHKPINLVYKALKGRYDLKRVTLTRKLHEEYTDVYVLKGKTAGGNFELYRDGLDLVFAPESGKTVRLSTPDEAIASIEEFAQNTAE